MNRERYTLMIIFIICINTYICGCVVLWWCRSNLMWSFTFFINRDFAYVARDNLTQVLKCHVFRCDSPAKNIATSLHEMCSKVSQSLLLRLGETESLPRMLEYVLAADHDWEKGVQTRGEQAQLWPRQPHGPRRYLIFRLLKNQLWIHSL